MYLPGFTEKAKLRAPRPCNRWTSINENKKRKGCLDLKAIYIICHQYYYGHTHLDMNNQWFEQKLSTQIHTLCNGTSRAQRNFSRTGKISGDELSLELRQKRYYSNDKTNRIFPYKSYKLGLWSVNQLLGCVIDQKSPTNEWKSCVPY